MIKIILISLLAMAFTWGVLKDAQAQSDAHEEEKGHHHKEKPRVISLEDANKHKLTMKKVGSGSINQAISLFGKIEMSPEKSMHIHPKGAGIVKEVFKSLGDKVSAGTPLARIESNLGVDSYNLVSVIDGVVLEKNISSGQSVNEETETFTIADTSILRASLTAYPKDLSQLRVGQPAYFQNPRTKKFIPSSISYISPLLNEKTHTGQIFLQIDNKDHIWLAGQYVLAKVFFNKKEVSATIRIEILSDPQQDSLSLFVKGEQDFSLVEISLGERDLESVEVTSGLKEGDSYIAMHANELEIALKGKEKGDEHELHND